MHSFKRAISLLIPAILAVTLSACSGVGVKPSLTAEPPKDAAFSPALKKELSTLSVPIEASTDDLGRVLNQAIRRDLYKGSTGTRGLSADVLRNGPIAVSAADNFLYFTVPITMSLSYGMFETLPISLKLKFKATARVTPDWKMSTEIYYVGLSDLLAEEVGIGPLSIKPRRIAEGITQPVQKVLSDMVNRKINEAFPLKSEIAKVWFAAQKPVLLDRNYNAWLTIAPREVMLSPLSAQNNRVRVNVGITSYAEVAVGPQPVTPRPVPLPNLKLVNSFDRNFRIVLNADLFYKDLLAIASPLLLNREFNSDGKTVVLRDLDLYGNGDRVVVKVATNGSLDGVFYLTGKPRFDPQTKSLSVEDVDFDLQTESLLLQSADWFLHGTIRSTIQEKLNMDLAQRLEDSRTLAQKAIAQVQLADHLLLKGNIKTLKVGEVLVQKDRISVQVHAEGETGVFYR